MTVSLVTLAGFFLFVAAAIVCAGYYLVVKPARRAALAAEQNRLSILARQDSDSTRSQVAGALENLGQAIPRKQKGSDPIRRLLGFAGYRSPSALHVFEGARIASAVLLAAVFSWIGAWWIPGTYSGLSAALIGGVFGYMFPERILEGMIAQRCGRLRTALPAALDIWSLAIEAGQPLEMALADSSRELQRVFPDLSAELANVQAEIRAGKSRTDVLNDIASRNRETELKKVCKLLIDGERFGTTLAPSLRNHARYLRIRSRQKAQESARKVSVKLVFPVFFLIFPAVILITLGPAVIRVATLFQTLMELK